VKVRFMDGDDLTVSVSPVYHLLMRAAVSDMSVPTLAYHFRKLLDGLKYQGLRIAVRAAK
jgi:hypothetical protein